MRKQKKVKIDNKEIVVKELRVRDMLELMEEWDKEQNFSLSYASKILECATEGVNLEDLKDFTPSELKIIWDAFEEVNSVFFKAAQAVGLGKVVVQIKDSLINDLSRLLVNSSRQDMV